MGVRLVADILHGLIDAVNGVCLFVGNLNAKLLLDRHNNFNRIQAV